MSRQIRPLLFLILVCGLLTSTLQPTTSTAESEGKGQALIVGSIGSPSLLNPYFSADASSAQVESLLFNGLVKFDEKLNPVPDLADRWEVSKDGYSWTFHLKRGILFHDGEELTSEDVVFSYNIPRRPGYTGPRGSDFEKIKDIRVVDRYTLNITLKEPYAPFLSTCVYAILPAHLLKQVPAEKLAEHPFSTKSPVGTGPYRFERWKDGQFVQLSAFPSYFDGVPQIQKLYFRIIPDQNAQLIQLHSGGIDVMGVPATDLAVGKLFEKQGKIKLHSSPTLSYTYIGYNLNHPFFQDTRVRQALTHALDREQIVNIVLEGEGQVAHTHGSPLSWAYAAHAPKFPYDPKKARELLAQAGWNDTDGDGVLDKDGEKFSFVLQTNQGNKMREMVAQIVQEQWAQIGVEVKPRLMEWSAFINDYVETKKFDAVMLGWSLGIDPDPTAIWHSKEAEKGLNFVSFKNKEIDRLLEANTREMDREKRKRILIQLQERLAQEQPYTFLYYANSIMAYPVNLEGVFNHPAGGFYKIQHWRYH
ncbi:peptide-binding protein [Ammoniphilus sp. YIM 78166]|uniref:peptide-binding protein n=1 Tax=Ammoniphilus sp. YIM 78166 TaxID=1644106 RepID=UPI00106F2779|nr:peptide-binding protein [Ammoniphilus sp. YIM 78166]